MTCPCRPLCFSPRHGCSPDTGPEDLPRTRAQEIRSLPMFAGLDGELLQRMMADAHPVESSRGTLLFTEGSCADAFYVVLTGQIKLFALLSDGRESIIEIIRPVATFGEAAVLAGKGFPVNAEVIEDATLIKIGRRSFLSTLREDHQVAYRILAAMAAWRLRLSSEAYLLRQQSAWHRVAEYLLSYAPATGMSASFRLPFSKEVLASRMGIRRESLSRVLARMRPLGVRTSGLTIHISDPAMLREMLRQGTVTE